MAMDDLIGKTCPYCQSPIKDEENIIVCTKCETLHHSECWDENKECTTFGCDEKRGALASEVEISSIENIDLIKKKCPYCAEEILAEAIKCKHCQTMLEDSLREVAAIQEATRQQANNLELQNVGSWNWYAFLFGPFWYMYKGMAVKGIGIFILGFILGAISSGVGSLLFAFYCGINGNEDYQKHMSNQF